MTRTDQEEPLIPMSKLSSPRAHVQYEHGGPTKAESRGGKRDVSPYYSSLPAAEDSHRDDQDLTPGLEDAPMKKKAAQGYASSSDGTPVTTAEHAAPRWRPFWLRQAVLGAFCAFFFCCAIGIPILASFSQRNHGLGEVRESMSNLWRFGTVAVLTLVSLFWARVELQALRYMPWTAVHAGSTVDYSLDYTAMFPPAVLVHSFRNRHVFVFLVCIVSLLAKLQIVLSPSLFYSREVETPRQTSVGILDRFANSFDPAKELAGDPTRYSAYYHARGMQDFDMGLPFGVTKDGIFETFRADSGSSRGTTDAILEATTAALLMDMKCLVLKDQNNTIRHDPAKSHIADTWVYDVGIEFESGCKSTVAGDFIWIDTERTVWGQSVDMKGDCHSLHKQQHGAYLYYAGYWRPSPHNASVPRLEEFAAVLCSSRTSYSPIKVRDDGIAPSMSDEFGIGKLPTDINIWKMVIDSIPSDFGGWSSSEANLERSGVVMGPLNAAYTFRQQTTNSTDRSLYESDKLRESVLSLATKIGPLAAHYHLRQNRPGGSGSAVRIMKLPRLHINRGIAIAMAIGFGVSGLIALWALFRTQSVFKAWHRDPATLLGSIAFFAQHGRLGQDGGRQAVVENLDSQKATWSSSKYTSLALQTPLRIAFCIYATLLIIALAVTLQISSTSDGLLTVSEHITSIWWTTVPAVAMIFVAFYATSSDTAVRDLAVISNMATRPYTAKELDISFLDMLGIQALYHSLRQRTFIVTIAQVTAVICGFLTALSTLAFTSEIIPERMLVNFPQASQFVTRTNRDVGWESVEYFHRRTTLGGLLVMKERANFTWPSNTYDNLIFPALDTNNTQFSNNNDIFIDLNIPAAKLTDSCREIPASEYEVTLTKTRFSEARTYQYGLNLTRPLTCPDGQVVRKKSTPVILSTKANEGYRYFAGSVLSGDNIVLSVLCDNFSYASRDDDPVLPWATQTYFWGNMSLSYSSTPKKLDYFSVWTCNSSWSEVDVDLRMIKSDDGKFQIDHTDRQPVAHDASARPWEPAFSVPDISFAFPQIDGVNDTSISALPKGFDFLVEPFGPLKVEDFGDASKAGDIIKVIGNSRAVLAAQLANLEHREGINSSSDARDQLSPVRGELVNKRRRRLVQNTGVTIAIMAILGTVLLINLWALAGVALRPCMRRDMLLDMELRGVAPDEFHSISMTAALLRGSNVFEVVPKSAQYMPPGELYSRLANVRFQLGWFFGKDSQERELTVGVLNDPNFQFTGPK